MTPEQISGYVTLVIMVILVFFATIFVSGPKYEGHGIYYLTINGIFRGNKDYCRWLKQNKVYLWCCLLIFFLCPTILSLAPSFRSGNMIVRPEIMTWINPFLWLSLLMSLMWFFNRIKQ